MKNKILETATTEARLGKEANLQKAEDMLMDYLITQPKDTYAWLLLTRIECNSPFEDADRIKHYAEHVLTYDPENPYALLFLSYADYYLRGSSDETLYSKLLRAKSDNSQILSMIEIAKAYYWEDRDPQKFEDALKSSIKHCSSYVTNYTELGKLYIKQGKKTEGKKLIRIGLSNIKKEITPENLDEPYDPTSIPNLLAEFFSGTRTTYIVHEMLLGELNN